jgi:hypothetical protein
MMPTTRGSTSCFVLYVNPNSIGFTQRTYRIWEQLKNAHTGNAQVQARLYATYQREYENFS